MQQEIETVQSRGYALDLGEEVSEIWCAASPIFDYREYPSLPCGCPGPSSACRRWTSPGWGPSCGSTPCSVSKHFGYDPSVARFCAFKPPQDGKASAQ